MIKYRPYLLVLVSMVLAGFVWMDNHDFIVSLVGGVWPTTSVSTAIIAPPSAKPSTMPGGPVSTDQVSRPVGNPLVSIDKTALENWVNRPLFAPARRRPAPQTAAARSSAPKPPPEYTLIGVVLHPNRTTALLRSVSSGANFHVEVGDTLSGWKVATVDRNAVTLVHDDEPAQIIRFKEECANAAGDCP